VKINTKWKNVLQYIFYLISTCIIIFNGSPGFFTVFFSAFNFQSDALLAGNEVRQKAEPSVWAKRYVVVEIPPYCRQQGEEEGRKGEQGEEQEEEEQEEEELGESWSPMVPSMERHSGEAMDCSSILEEEEEQEIGPDPM